MDKYILMDNNVNILLNNGLGDQFLDLIGFYVICKYLNYNPIISFNNNCNFDWGNNNYDMQLFSLKDISIAKTNEKNCKLC